MIRSGRWCPARGGAKLAGAANPGDRMAQVIVVRNNRCQLANQLLHIASVYAWCRARGHTLNYLAFGDYARHFPVFRDNPLGVLIGPRPAWAAVGGVGVGGLGGVGGVLGLAVPAAARLAAGSGLFGPRLRARHRDPQVCLPPTDPTFREPEGRRVFVEGWNLRNPLGLAQYAAEIRTLLAPGEEAAERTRVFRALLPKDRLLIGVHVRHRDYRTFLNGQLYMPVEEFRDTMRRLADRHARARPHFVVCSDEPRDAGEFPGLDCTISGGDLIDDMHRLAGCDAIVGPLSTYSMWAAYVGGVRVRHYKARPDEPISFAGEGYPTLFSDAELDAWLEARVRERGLG
jgi:hypothetical protein